MEFSSTRAEESDAAKQPESRPAAACTGLRAGVAKGLGSQAAVKTRTRKAAEFGAGVATETGTETGAATVEAVTAAVTVVNL